VSGELQAFDLILSSGFLAYVPRPRAAALHHAHPFPPPPHPPHSFAAHSGFLAAVDEAGLASAVRGVMGTSAGALAGALYSAGYAPEEMADVLSEKAPLSYLSLNSQALWTGMFRLDGAVERLRELLPATFEELPMRFAVGVIDARGRHVTLSSGALPEAVAASMAVPCLFRAVDIPGARAHAGPYADGGKVDRVGLRPWRRLVAADVGASAQAVTPALCHVIERSSPFSGDDDVEAAAREAGPPHSVLLVRSPRSRQSLLQLTDFQPQFQAARARAALVLAAAPQLAAAR